MEHNQSVDDLLSYKKVTSCADYFTIFLSQGYNLQGKTKARHRLGREDYDNLFVYENYEKILSDERFWDFGAKIYHIFQERFGRKLLERRFKRVRNFRKNLLSLEDKKRKSRWAREREYYDLGRTAKMQEVMKLRGVLQVLFDLSQNSDPIQYVDNNPSFETDSHDIYDSLGSSFDFSLNQMPEENPTSLSTFFG